MEIINTKKDLLLKIKKTDLKDIYRTLHSSIRKFILFSMFVGNEQR